MAVKTLSGKVAIVTGGGRGLGRAMALGLVGAGAHVTITDVDKKQLDETVKAARRVGGKYCILAVQADAAKAADAERVVRATIDEFDGLHILVNNAAIGPQVFQNSYLAGEPGAFWDMKPTQWRDTILVNAFGPFLMARAVAPRLVKQRWGRIIGVTTSLDTMIKKGLPAYGPSKAAHEALVAIMSQDFVGTGVTANVLVPGGPANTRMIPAEGAYAKRAALIQPEVMVPPLLWLVSDAANAVNGNRFRAALWNPTLLAREAAAKASAPVAWTQLGRQSIHPT